MTSTIHCGDALAVLQSLPAGAARCCVTSPPYWGLRDYGVEGQLGLEKTPEEYVARMVLGAGARINQELPADTDPTDIWKDAPDSAMTIYFVFEEQFNVMAQNMIDTVADRAQEGMLSGLPVG